MAESSAVKEASSNGSKTQEKQVSQQEEESTEIAPEDIKILVDLGGQEFAEQLVEVYQHTVLKIPGEKSVKSATSEVVDDKWKRKSIHEVNLHFPVIMVSC